MKNDRRPLVLVFSTILLLSAVPAQVTSPPAADAAGSNLPAQPIGADDLIATSVYGSPELTRTLRVSPEGEIHVPMLKQPIRAAGLLPNRLEATIADALRAEKILVDPVVTVTIVEYRSRKISVVGAVKKPLIFQAYGAMTLLDALARAEGLTPDAGPEILVSGPSSGAGDTGKPLMRRIPVKALLDGADRSLNLRLQGGEEIRVPESGKVFVVGCVRKPGVYPVNDLADTTVLKVLALTEGLTPYASKQAYIYRREATASGKSEIVIEIRNILARKSPDVQIEANDILYVPDNKGRRIGLAVLEKVLLFGSTAGASALVYGQLR